MDLVAVSTALAALIKSSAWPIVTGLGLYFYRPSVSKLLERVTEGELGPTGAKVKAIPPNQSTAESPQKEVEDQVKEISGQKGLPFPDEYLDSLSLPTVTFVERDFKGDFESQRKWLARILAIAISQRSHEETHRLIFGSQLNLLYRINSYGGRIAVEQAKHLYQEAAMSFREIYKVLSFDSWIGFLKARGLIENFEGAAEPSVMITLGGKSYLQYIIERQLPPKDMG